jgi:Na+-driven multidrug efflux pump
MVGFSHLASAILRGLDRPVAPTVILMVCWCMVRVISVLTIGRFWHRIELAYWLYPVTWMLSTVVFVLILSREFKVSDDYL